MIVDLVQTTAADGIRLDGALHAAAVPVESLRAGALLCLGGVGTSFYAASLLRGITPALVEAGATMLWANTRGHDLMYTAYMPGGARQQGAAFEIVDECRLDVTAWLDYLVARGFERVGILGHSLGAIKAVYSEAHQPHASACCVLALSPPRLSCAALGNGPQSGAFSESLALAQQHVQAARPEQLIEATFPFPLLISAGTFMDKYGPAERYNLLNFADRVRPPMLFTYGGGELERGGVAFAGLPEALRALPEIGQRLEVVTIADADHNYTGKHAELAAVLVEWLRAERA